MLQTKTSAVILSVMVLLFWTWVGVPLGLGCIGAAIIGSALGWYVIAPAWERKPEDNGR